MLDQTQQWQTLWWEETPQGARVRLLDQTLLPLETVYLTLGNAEEVAEAIRALRVRGAPAIAAAAAFGVVLGLREQIQVHGAKLSVAEARACVESVGSLLASTRPTAVNLAWAVKRLLNRADALLNELDTAEDLARLLLDEVQAIVQEDRAACQRMGELGAELITEGDTLLTHCNTGALATMGQNSAAGVGNAAMTTGANVSNLLQQQGAAQAGGVLAGNNAIVQGIGGLAGLFSSMPGSQQQQVAPAARMF